ncbi:hypothetical protein [Rubripirellula lacrimiformis]|uniref:hypothetical protein n=1 Tax=Rubripirellula lacrimiformis TaxID=1930273 RepID=UPI0011A49316|nr:hypothetical protein [Rubripirellula lacrimiformis]
MNPFSPSPDSRLAIESKLESKPTLLHERPVLTFFVATATAALLNLAEFLVLDWFTVRVWPYPDEVGQRDWFILAFPLLPLIVLAMISRFRLLDLHAGSVLGAGILGFICSIPLCATVGIWFHFAIGGKL